MRLNRRWTDVALLTILSLLGAGLPGCVFWDIRDELKKTNAQLDEVKSSLGKLDVTNASLDKTNRELERVNAVIESVDRGLGRIDTTNASLDGLQKPLGLMQPIERSLARLDAHLAALRTTIGRIDSMIPFLDLTGGETVAEAPAPAPDSGAAVAGDTPPAGGQQEAVAGGVAPSGEGQSAAPGRSAAADRRDPLAGAWLSKFPERNLAIFLLTDGTYVQALRGPSSVARVRGTWKRDGKFIVLQRLPDAETVTRADGKTEPREVGPRRLELVWSSARALALDIDDQLVVFERP